MRQKGENMKIFGFTQGIQNTQVNKFGIKNNNYLDKSLFVSQDTVSFGAGQSIPKLIEEFKRMDPAGNYDMKTSELIKVYEYFGFKLVKGGSSHSRLIGPYGQTTTVVTSRAKVNPGAASDLIRALKRADEFNGELMISETEPSPEKIAEWKETIKTKSPKPDHINHYALDLQKKLTEEQAVEIEKPQTINENKDVEIRIANAKSKIQTALVKIENDTKTIYQIKDDIESLRKLNKESKIHSLEEDIKILLDKLIEIEVTTTEKKNTINSYSKQVNNGYPLSEDEEKNLEKIATEEVNFTNIKKELAGLESKYLEIQEHKEILQNSIEEIIIDSKIFADDTLTELQKITAKITDPAVHPFINRAKKEKIENLIKEIKAELKLQHKQIEKYQNLNTDKYTKEDLERIKTSLQNSLVLRDNYAQIENKTFAEKVMVKLDELRFIFKNDVEPLSDFSAEEIESNRSKQIDKFNKKLKKTQDEKESKEAEGQKEKEVKGQEIQTVKPQAISHVETTQNKPVQTIIEATSKQDTSRFDNLDQNKKEMISKLSEKVIPLPLPSVLTAVKNVIAKNFDFDAFGQVKGDKTKIKEFISAEMKKITKNPEFSRIKNATKFAMLHELSRCITNETPQIYEMNKAEIATLFEEIKEGKTNIRINTQTSNTPITINLKQKINTQTLNLIFEKYSVSISEKQKIPNWETSKGKNIIDEMLKYSPEFSEKELQDFLMAIMEEGAYLELLIDENADDLLKSTVLKNFWSEMDAKNGTTFAESILEKYKKEIAEKKEAIMQQQKLDSIDKIDWTL